VPQARAWFIQVANFQILSKTIWRFFSCRDSTQLLIWKTRSQISRNILKRRCYTRQSLFTTCLAIFMRYKLQEKLTTVTYPEMNVSCNFFWCRNRCEKKKSVLLFATTLATLQRIFPALRRGVTVGNVGCNLFRNGATKLRDKLQEESLQVSLFVNGVLRAEQSDQSYNFSHEVSKSFWLRTSLDNQTKTKTVQQ